MGGAFSLLHGRLLPQGLRRYPGSWGTGPSSPGPAGRGIRWREAHVKANGAEPDQGGRGSSGHQHPLGLRGVTFQGRTLRRLPWAQARLGEHEASEGGAGTWGSFFRGRAPASPERDRGGVAGRLGPAKAAPCPAACGPRSASWPRGGTRRTCRGVSSAIPRPVSPDQGQQSWELVRILVPKSKGWPRALQQKLL